jgi:hypothetical protein
LFGFRKRRPARSSATLANLQAALNAAMNAKARYVQFSDKAEQEAHAAG